VRLKLSAELNDRARTGVKNNSSSRCSAWNSSSLLYPVHTAGADAELSRVGVGSVNWVLDPLLIC